MKRKYSLVLFAALFAALFNVQAASAAYVSFDSWFGLEISDQSSSETNSITITNGTGSDDYVVTDTAGVSVDGIDCIQDSSTQATCTAVTRTAGVGYAELGDGDDTLVIDGTFQGFDIYGGSGNDTISAGSGNSVIFGEDGQDWINPGLGNDSVVGGDDTDTVSYSDRLTDTSIYPDGTNTEGSQTVIASASGSSGEQDKISSDVENLQSGSGNDALYGNTRVNRFICGAGSDTVIAAESIDTIDPDCEVDSRSAAPGASAPASGGGSNSASESAGSAGSSLATGIDSGLGKITVSSKTKTARLASDHTLKVKVTCSVYSQSGTCGVSGTLRYRGKTVAIATDTLSERKGHWLVFTLKKKIYKQLRKAIKVAKKKRKKLTLTLALKGSAVIQTTALPASAVSSSKVIVK